MTEPAQNHSRRTPKPINNLRAHQRRELSAPIPVFNLVNGESMGALINITVEGLMLMCNREIDSTEIYQIELRLPNYSTEDEHGDAAANADSVIELSVDCLWCRNEENNQRYWAGFQIVDATQRSIKLIEKLIRDHAL